MLNALRKSTVLTTFIIILFAGFLFTSACILFLAKHNLYELIIISLIPDIIIFIIAILYEKDKFGKKIVTVISSIIFGISVLGLFIISFFVVFIDPHIPTTDITSYSKALKYYSYPGNEEIAFFPEKITPDMENVLFYHIAKPAILTNHIAYQLFFETSPENAASYERQFKSQATSILEIDEQYYGHFIYFNGVDKWISDWDSYPNILVSEEKFPNKQLPPGYIIYFLTKPEFANSSYGVAINKEKCEMLFFYLLDD